MTAPNAPRKVTRLALRATRLSYEELSSSEDQRDGCRATRSQSARRKDRTMSLETPPIRSSPVSEFNIKTTPPHIFLVFASSWSLRLRGLCIFLAFASSWSLHFLVILLYLPPSFLSRARPQLWLFGLLTSLALSRSFAGPSWRRHPRQRCQGQIQWSVGL